MIKGVDLKNVCSMIFKYNLIESQFFQINRNGIDLCGNESMAYRTYSSLLIVSQYTWRSHIKGYTKLHSKIDVLIFLSLLNSTIRGTILNSIYELSIWFLLYSSWDFGYTILVLRFLLISNDYNFNIDYILK